MDEWAVEVTRFCVDRYMMVPTTRLVYSLVSVASKLYDLASDVAQFRAYLCV